MKRRGKEKDGLPTTEADKGILRGENARRGESHLRVPRRIVLEYQIRWKEGVLVQSLERTTVVVVVA